MICRPRRILALFLLAVMPTLCAPPKKKIIITGATADVVKELQEVAPDAEIVSLLPARSQTFTRLQGGVPRTPQDREEMSRQVADADAFIGMPNQEILKAAKKLRWVQASGAGVETLRFPELIDSDIVLTNLQKIASPGIADHAMGMLLALTRQLVYHISARTQAGARAPVDALELQGMTGVIIGVGGVGSSVAVRAWASGMKLIGVDPRDISPTPFIQRAVYPDRLDSVLPEADVVFVCAPDTPESRNMMGQRQFDLMKKGSYFIAVSRGTLYNMDALVSVLASGKLAGAGVDVTNPEPLPRDHPLRKFENVIITPHMATRSQNEGRRQIELLKENISRFLKGEPLKYVVDKHKGY